MGLWRLTLSTNLCNFNGARVTHDGGLGGVGTRASAGPLRGGRDAEAGREPPGRAAAAFVLSFPRSAALAMKTLPRGLQPRPRAPSPNGEPRHGVGGGSPARQVRPQPSPIGQRCAAAGARGQ